MYFSSISLNGIYLSSFSGTPNGCEMSRLPFLGAGDAINCSFRDKERGGAAAGGANELNEAQEQPASAKTTEAITCRLDFVVVPF